MHIAIASASEVLTLLYYLCRYLARAILIPFIYEAPSVRVDTLDAMLSEAHRALPEAVAIGKWLVQLPQSHLYEMVEKVQEVMLGKLDGRLAMQYAIYIVCSQEVINIIILYIFSHRIPIVGLMHAACDIGCSQSWVCKCHFR